MNTMNTIKTFILLTLFTVSTSILYSESASAASFVSLDFSSLPSAQGWNYNSFNSPLSESQAFSVNGSALQMSTIGQGFQGQGDNVYDHQFTYQAGAVYELDFTAKVPQYEMAYSNPALNPGGFAASLTVGGDEVYLGMSGDVQVINSKGGSNVYNYTVSNITFDTSGWNDYRIIIDTTNNTYSVFIDNLLENSGSLVTQPSSYYSSGIAFGDFTGGENAIAVISSLSAFQTTTPIPAAIWLVGSALAGLVGFSRRKTPV